MVMSIGEEIAALEAEYSNVSGQGSKAKKEEIRVKIDALKKQDEESPEEQEDKGKVVAAPSIPAPLPPYKKTTMDQVREAEKAGKLCGFDPDAMTASIKA